MVERRDVELLIRAKDLSTKPLRDVARAIDDIASSLDQQVASARRGEVSYQELATSLRQVQEAGKGLAGLATQIQQFQRLTSESTRLAASVDKAGRELRDFSATLAGQATTTKRQESQFAALERALQRAQVAQQRNREALEASRASLAQAGVSTQTLVSAQRQIIASATQAGQAATVLSTAMDGYARNAREAAQAERARREALKQSAAADAAAARAAEQAEAQKRAAIAATNKALQEQERQRNALLQAARAAATAGQREDAQATARDTAAAEAARRAAQQAVADAQRIATQRGPVQPAVQDAGRSLRSLIDPAAQARSTLAGLERQLEATAAAVAAIDGPFKGYEATLGQVAAAQRRLVGIGDLVDRFRAQTAAVQASRQAFVQARGEVQSYEAQIRSAGAPSEALSRSLRTAQTNLANAAREFRAQATAARDTQIQLRRAGVDTARLAQEQDRLQRAAAQTARVTDQLTAAFQRFGRSNRGDGFLGLSPYAIQNLGFQINDLFTQIASGTSVTQALAQQGGQILQVFGPGAFSAVSRWIPMLAGVAGGFAAVVAALSRLNQTAASNRSFAGNLSLMGGETGFGVSAAQLTEIARRVERLSVSFEDARKTALTFLRDGLAPANIRAASEASARLATVLGVEVTDAARLVSRALREGQAGYVALQEAGVRFTQAERDAIRQAYETTDAFQRQSAILDILTRRFNEAEQQALGPWDRAVRNLRNGWHDFLDDLGNTAPLQGLKTALDAVAGGAQAASQAFATLGRSIVSALAPGLVVLNDLVRLARMIGFLPPAAATPRPGDPTGRLPVGGMTPGRQQAERARERQVMEFERDERTLPRETRIRAARELARREFLEQNPEASDVDLAEIQDIAEIAIRRKIQEELARGGAAAAAQVRRDFQAITQDIQNTVRARDETIRGIQEDVAAGALSPAEAVRRIQEAADQARPALQRLAEEAKRFRDQNAGGDAVRRAAMDAQIARAEREAGGLGSRAGTRQVLAQARQEAQQLLQERQQFVQSQNALVQQGVITQSEAQERIREQYNATNETIRGAVDAYAAANQAAIENASITQAQAANNAAAIELWRAQLDYVDPAMARLRQGIDQVVSQSALSGFDSMAEAIGNAVAGVTSFSDAFDEAGRAALKFVADVLKGIAQVIIQEQILMAVQMARKALGLFHSGGVVGHGSGQRTRDVNPSWWINAPRYHSGSAGPIGLRPDEQAAILQRGEEVLARDDPRNMMNWGKGGASTSPTTALRQVLAIGDDEIAAATAGAAGEEVFLTHLRRNLPTIRQILRG